MDAIDKIIEIYKNSPIIRGLAQLLPTVAAADAAMMTQLVKMREKKIRVFFDELARGTQELNPDVIGNDDFLHAFFATVEAMLRTHREQKIQLFARLLCNFGRQQDSSNAPIDEYEEDLAVLDEMSLREIMVLSTLAEIEEKYPLKNYEGRHPSRAMELWPEFTARIMQDHGFTKQEMSAFLMRLMRTGFYQPLVGGYGGGSFDGVPGKLTASFYRFLERIR